MIRRSMLLGTLLLLPALPAAAGRPATVNDIRHSVTAGRTRIVIDLSKRASYTAKVVHAPERVAVNIPGARTAAGIHAVDIASGPVRRVRINRLSWGAQVVLDLRGPAAWQDFYLAPVENMPHRIVLDVRHPRDITEGKGPPATRPTPVHRSTKRRDIIVAIDAGHGGTDPGALGRYRIVEKREALDIARRLAREIDGREGYKAVMTRERDVFISLLQRTRIAQQKGADIFVSVHLNSAPRKNARGSEVYFLSPGGAKKTAARLMRDTRSAARALGVQNTSSADIIHMLVDVNQQTMLRKSSLLAEAILKALDRKGLPPARSIKQRSFAVLKSIVMPSVMVETGFVTSAQDAAILKSQSGKDKVARAIADGVVSFLKKHPPPTDETGRVFVHKVKKGDTLWKISRRYHTTVDSIRRANRLGGSKLIRVGQELVIREGYATR